MHMNKEHAYADLVSRVKKSYPTVKDLENEEGLCFYWFDDCEEINLWTYWQGRGNLDAQIMLVGQDWGSPWDESAQKTMAQITRANHGLPYDYLDENPSITDDRMITLFREIGYDIKQHCSDLFFTNFILGYRNKGLSGGYKKSWADHDKDYFKELTNIIEPKVILCLGRSTFEGVLSAFNIINSPRIKNFNSFIESEHNPISVTLDNGKTVFIFALAHCGAMGTLNRNRGKEKSDDILSVQKEDWKRIVPYL